MKKLFALKCPFVGACLPLCVTLIWLGTVPQVRAIIADPAPAEFTQPDGSKLTLYLRGDEFFHWHEDPNGFTVVRQNGTFVYARLDSQNQLVPTGWQAGQEDPRAHGLTPGVLPPPKARLKNTNLGLTPYRPWLATAKGQTGNNIAARGTVKNLVVLCKFSDHTFGVHTRQPSDYNVLFNQVGGDPILAPTGSVRDALVENSYGILTLQSTVLAWVTLPQTMAYYAGTNNGTGKDYPNNAHKMVEDALALADPLVNFGDFDADADGYIDAITIIHSGYDAAQTGSPANSIWSHKSNLDNNWVSADNNSQGVKVKVNLYHTEAALYGTSGTSILRIGVVSHETGHFFGLPDLYDTDNSSVGVGSWCMMGNSWGFKGDQLNPPHFSAWCKVFLGWTMPTFPIFVGISSAPFSLPQAETSPAALVVNHGFPSGEYLLIENRQPVGFDKDIPQGGLAIWHIDENVPCNCNTNEGHPGQPGWPWNGNHYKVALLQADGNFDLERTPGSGIRGDTGDLYRAGGVTRIDWSTLPSTDAYQNGIVCPTFDRISDISAPGSTMSFTYSFYPAVKHVDKFYTGSTSDGTCVYPYKSFANAYTAALDGDVIVLHGADYAESPLINLNKRITLDRWLGPATIR